MKAFKVTQVTELIISPLLLYARAYKNEWENASLRHLRHLIGEISIKTAYVLK